MKIVDWKFKQALKTVDTICSEGLMYILHRDGTKFYIVSFNDDLVSLEKEDVEVMFGEY